MNVTFLIFRACDCFLLVGIRASVFLMSKMKSPALTTFVVLNETQGIPAVCERYMVAFQYGSVVLFNFRDQEEEDSLNAVRKYCTDQFRESRMDGMFAALWWFRSVSS